MDIWVREFPQVLCVCKLKCGKREVVYSLKVKTLIPKKQYQHPQKAEEGLQLTINKFTGNRGPSTETYNFNIPFCPGLKAKKKA